MGKIKDGEIGRNVKKLNFTRYLQFQISTTNREIEEIQEEISTMEQGRVFGKKLTRLRNRLEYWKGKRDTFQEIWDYKMKKGI